MPFIITDSWEGNDVLLDLSVMSAGGVVGNNPRINAIIPYGHRKDKMFDAQWAAQTAFGFIGAPYFVPNNYISAQDNFKWLLENMPSNAGALLFDIELTRSDWTPKQYSEFISDLYKLCVTHWNIALYTGEWFIQYLSPWLDLGFWWSEYPFALSPAPVQTWTWEKFIIESNKFTGPLNASAIPSKKLFMWQCSGSTSPSASRPTGGLILPGSTKIMDVSLCYWKQEDLEAFYKQKIGVPVTIPPNPQPQPTMQIKVKSGINLNLRSSGSTSAPILVTEKGGTILDVLEDATLVKSKVGVANTWINVRDVNKLSGYVSGLYVELVDVTIPPNPQPTGYDGILYQAKTDMELASLYDIPTNFHSRTQLPEYAHVAGGMTPATEPLKGGVGDVPLSDGAIQRVKDINNNNEVVLKYIFHVNSGWQNSTQYGRVKEIGFEGGFYEVLKVDGGLAYPRVYDNNGGFPSSSQSRNPSLEHLFTVVTKDDKLIGSPKGNAYILLVARHGEQLTIPFEYLKPANLHVKTTGTNLNVRSAPVNGSVLKTLPSGTPIIVYELKRASDGNMWGRIDKNSQQWISMIYVDWM